MYSRSRKSQEAPNNGNIDDSTSYSQPFSQSNQHHHHHHHHHHNHSQHHHHTNTIPANKDGKRYTMNEVFEVWYDNKDQILNTEVPVSSDEPYKLAKPEQIYHLDLQSKSNNADELHKETTKELTDSLDKLTIGGDSEIENATQGSGIASIQTAVTDPGTATIASSIGQAPPGMTPLPKDLPSVESKFKPLLTSDKIEWYYIDPSGNEQGPFNGDMMQEWLAGGYLNLDLQIRRKEENGFKSLRELCENLLNYVTPFKVPLPDLTTASNSGSQFFPNDLLNNNFPPFQSNLLSSLGGNVSHSNISHGNLSQSNLFGNDFMKSDPFSTTSLAPVNQTSTQGFGGSTTFGIDTFNQQPSTGLDAFNHNLSFPSMPSILQQQIHQQQQPTLSRVNSGWGVDTSTSSILQSGSNPQTPIGGHAPLPSQISQPVPNSPWLPSAVAQSHSRVNSPFTSTTNLNLVGQDSLSVQHDVDANQITGVATQIPASSIGSATVEIAPQLEDPVLEEIHSSVVTDFLNDEEPKNVNPLNESIQSEVVVPQKPVMEEQPVASQPQPVEEKEIQDSAKPVDLKPSAPPALAPWAAPKQSSQKPVLTLKEIQRIEAERLAEQKKIEAQIKNEQAAKAWATAAAVEKQAKIERAATVLPSSWGTTSSAPVTKTLAEIQKEEAERAKAKLAVAANSATKLGSTNTSFANAAANSIPRDDGPAWTTVASKKQASSPIVKKASANVVTSFASKTTPQLLRSVSANKQNTTSINAQSVREDFLVWARSNMTSLYPTVSKEDLLDIFITLPPNSSDSASLIAETIYSSSATMDGRRFAQEFLKRRQKVDQQIGGGDHVSWSAAIISSADKVPTVDEDGWSTSQKSKKKNNKRN